MPLLSVIIPAHNNGAKIVSLVQSLNSWKFQKELLVVENGSTDGSGKALRELIAPGIKVILHVTSRSRGEILHTGLTQSLGELVLLPGQGYPLDPAWYGKLVESLPQDAHRSLVLGCRRPISLWDRFLHAFGHTPGASQRGEQGACILIRKDTLESLAIPAVCEDPDTCIIKSARRNKVRIILVEAPRTNA